jgi:hypothetical protein
MSSDREGEIAAIFSGFSEEALQSKSTQSLRAQLLALSDEEFNNTSYYIAAILIAHHASRKETSPPEQIDTWKILHEAMTSEKGQ